MKRFYQNRRGERLKAATAKRQKLPRPCLTPECENLSRPGRRYCNTCRNRLYDDPMRRMFRNLKSSAARRGKVFTLTLEDFRVLAVESGYDVGRGRHSDDLHIDRIDPDKGYEPGNVQVITARENILKEWHERAGWRPPVASAEDPY